MTQSIIGYKRTREEELYPTIEGYWLNSGVIWVRKSRYIEIDGEKEEDHQGVYLLPSELKEILKFAEGSFERSAQIYREDRVTPGMFPEPAILGAIAHPNGNIEVYYYNKEFNKNEVIILSFGEWKTILSKCQKAGREWC